MRLVERWPASGLVQQGWVLAFRSEALAEPLSLPAHHAPHLTPAGHWQWLLLRLPLRHLQWRWWPGADEEQLLGLALCTRYRDQAPGLWLHRRWRPGLLTSSWQNPFALELQEPRGFLRYELTPNQGGAPRPSLPEACYWGQAGTLSFRAARISPVAVHRFETNLLSGVELQGAAYLSSLAFSLQPAVPAVSTGRLGWRSMLLAKET
jgi:hypothetical protein